MSYVVLKTTNKPQLTTTNNVINVALYVSLSLRAIDFYLFYLSSPGYDVEEDQDKATPHRANHSAGRGVLSHSVNG